MRAMLLNEDEAFLAELDVPNGTEQIRFGERFFVPYSGDTDPAVYIAVAVYSAPVEGAKFTEG